MRRISGLTASALLAAAAPAAAQTVDPGTLASLFNVAFARSEAVGLQAGAAAVGQPPGDDLQARMQGPGGIRWTVREAALTPPGAESADTLRISTGGLDLRGLDTLQLRPGVALYPAAAENFDVAYIRGWPSALRVRTGGGYGIDITPHAGIGMSNRYGGSAEAGAMVRFGSNLEDRVKGALGVRDGGKAFGAAQRWYVFAAASGKAVGMNLVNTADGLQRSGLTMDQGGFVGQAQAGIGWRKGAMQASFGYVHERLKSHLFGVRSESDDRLALTFSFH